MRGFTQVLAAFVITKSRLPHSLSDRDANDSNYDSAVFLSSGSFTTNIDLGPDQNICDGNNFAIKNRINDPIQAQLEKNKQSLVKTKKH
jgi:hypothetical protein